MVAVPTPIEIFCSYANADDTWRQKLETHMSLLKRQGLISLWHNRQILPGTDWAKTIDTYLETASVILLLVSADFLASDYCYGVEMKHAIAREAAGEVRVIPILVRPVDWRDAPFAHLQPLPTDAKPLATWENQETALAAITADIRRVIETTSQLAASAPRVALPPIWNVPYPRNPFFLGRDEELSQIRHYLQRGQATALSQPQAISGLGGIGKTQLALEYAYRYHQDYQTVLWARAESTEALVSSYIAIAALLRLPEHEARDQDIAVQAVKTWLQTHRDWLLVLDNADELTLLPDFLPPSLGGHLLLTTRAAATGRLAHRLEIETLSPPRGALFLLRRAALLEPFEELSQASCQERELAERLSQELGGLPLALDQAGAYLEETGTSLSSYWYIYKQYRADLLRKRGGLVTDHPAPVATTWSLSFQQVEEKKPAAAELLRLCAFLSPDVIPEEILTVSTSLMGLSLAEVTTDTFRLNQAIEALRAYSLVRRDPKGKTLSIHRLVQAVIQDTLSEGERRIWAERAMLSVNAAFPRPKPDNWSQCERLLPQAMLVAQHIEQYQIIDEEAGRLLYETAVYLRRRARHQEAELLYRRALRIREQKLGPEHPHVANSLDALAYLYLKQGKYAEAEPLYRRTLRIREQKLGPEHPHVASSLHSLALLSTVQGNYSEAELLYQRALHILEEQLGSEHPQVAYPLDGLARLYALRGKYTEAELLYQRALHILEEQLRSEDPEVAFLLNNLAGLYTEQKKYAQAEPLYRHALQMWEQQLGPQHPNVAYPLDGLANLYYEQGKYTEAEPLYLRALRIREQALGPEHPETAETMYDLARFREAQGNSEEARILYARTLGIREQALGIYHPNTTETRKRFIALCALSVYLSSEGR